MIIKTENHDYIKFDSIEAFHCVKYASEEDNYNKTCMCKITAHLCNHDVLVLRTFEGLNWRKLATMFMDSLTDAYCKQSELFDCLNFQYTRSIGEYNF